MKKFINEYKALRSKSETERIKVDTTQMGVFKWLRRERVTVTEDVITPIRTTSAPDANFLEQQSHSGSQVGTIRTEEYKRDLAEFQARRSAAKNELLKTPVKKKCSRHSLPVSCTACATDPDNTFNYEKKSATKYKKKQPHKRARSATAEDRYTDVLPSIQFLFQNQVFMPGTHFSPSPCTDTSKTRRSSQKKHLDDVQKQLQFSENQTPSPPLFYKNNCLPVDSKVFVQGAKSGEEEIDGVEEDNVTSRSSSDVVKNDETSVWEVINELKSFDQWADEQLQMQSMKSDDSKSETSAYGLPVASAVNLDFTMADQRAWNHGSWGMVPVQLKKLKGVTVQHVKKKANTEINILRKYRHPNIILLMGLYPDIQGNVYIICERCVDTLYGILHIQGRILSAQTSVQYALDIANALVFLRMQGFLHTALTSHSIMITSHDAAKLADLGSCTRLFKEKPAEKKPYEVYSPEPQYVNIEDTHLSTTTESEPLLSQHPSETYLTSNAVTKPYKIYADSEHYRWQAPELFEPDQEGYVHPCAKSDVYSLCLVIWECCNAALPWKTLTYEKLKELYLLWNTGIRLPQDGTYPGSLLALLQSGLKLSRAERIDLNELQSTLAKVKRDLDALEYIIIPARLSKKKSGFSSTAWDTNSPTDESDCLSPLANNLEHKADVHKSESSGTSAKDSKSENSPLYETLRKVTHFAKASLPDTCYISDEGNTEDWPKLKYEHLPEKDFSSACSTPLAKIRARMKDVGTPGSFHRSDSTEYCSFVSPDTNFQVNETNLTSAERSTAKLSRSFTPKSYKPLHIKVPECNFDSVKSVLKNQSATEQSLYNFDIKNYSLPTTPIARSNKLRRNAWLSGDLSLEKKAVKTSNKDESKNVQSAPETPSVPPCISEDNMEGNLNDSYKEHDQFVEDRNTHSVEDTSPESFFLRRGSSSTTILRRMGQGTDSSPETGYRESTNTWSFKSSMERAPPKYKVEEDVLANVNVKPLVAIHEKWIYEANRKTGRSMSLPEDNVKCSIPAVKPASHCVDVVQKSLPQLSSKKTKPFRGHPVSPASSKSGGHWDQFCHAREAVAKSINFGSRDGSDRFRTWKKDNEKEMVCEDLPVIEQKTDQATDTQSIEEFIKDLIRKEFNYILHEISDDRSSLSKNDEIINKGVANIVENLKSGEERTLNVDETLKTNNLKSFSRVKINGNNKPLLQITFNRSGENTLQVLDSCVNVTICDNSHARDKLDVSLEDAATDDGQVHSLKRCQAFNAIQEARSTEDLYIDDELSTQLQENFGGRVKLIPLHGSLHEILCEKEDDCCLIKVKQENGCDTIYFKCDNSDTESRDAIDGCPFDNSQDTVVYKRSISLVEERIQRIFPKDKKGQTSIPCRIKSNDKSSTRPKSEILVQTLNQATKVLSTSSPSLCMRSENNDEVEVNIENVMSYQDSSSDECLKCHSDTEEFEVLEKKIESELLKPLNPVCFLQKISEENLSVANEEADSEGHENDNEYISSSN